MCSRSAFGSAEMRSSSTAAAASVLPSPCSPSSSIRRFFEPPPESNAAAILISHVALTSHHSGSGSLSQSAVLGRAMSDQPAQIVNCEDMGFFYFLHVDSIILKKMMI
jgi:hypothetical protein